MWKRKYVTCPIEAWMFWTDCVGGDGWIGITRSSHYVLGPICTRLILWLGSSGTPNTPDHSKSVDIFICLLSMYVGGPAKGFLSLEERKHDWLIDGPLCTSGPNGQTQCCLLLLTPAVICNIARSWLLTPAVAVSENLVTAVTDSELRTFL